MAAWQDFSIVQRVVAQIPRLPDALKGSLPTVEEIEAELIGGRITEMKVMAVLAAKIQENLEELGV